MQNGSSSCFLSHLTRKRRESQKCMKPMRGERWPWHQLHHVHRKDSIIAHDLRNNCRLSHDHGVSCHVCYGNNYVTGPNDMMQLMLSSKLLDATRSESPEPIHALQVDEWFPALLNKLAARIADSTIQVSHFGDRKNCPPLWHAIHNLDVLVAGEAKVHEPFAVQQAGGLLQQSDAAAVVFDEIVKGRGNPPAFSGQQKWS